MMQRAKAKERSGLGPRPEPEVAQGEKIRTRRCLRPPLQVGAVGYIAIAICYVNLEGDWAEAYKKL